MCIQPPTSQPDAFPITTNLGIGQCAGSAAGGAELHAGHAPHSTLVPANVAAAADGGDDAGSGGAGFELLFAVGAAAGEYSVSEDMQMVMQEFVADPEGRTRAVRHVGE
jgi:hypothetical protein